MINHFKSVFSRRLEGLRVLFLLLVQQNNSRIEQKNAWPQNWMNAIQTSQLGVCAFCHQFTEQTKA